MPQQNFYQWKINHGLPYSGADVADNNTIIWGDYLQLLTPIEKQLRIAFTLAFLLANSHHFQR